MNCAGTLEEALKGKLDVGAGAVRESGPESGWSFYEVTYDPRGEENAPVGSGTGGFARSTHSSYVGAAFAVTIESGVEKGLVQLC